MKKLMKKILAITVMAALIAGVMPLAGLEGLFKFSPVTVKAADVDPFDTSKLTKTGSGNYAGASWTTYDNGLVWVVDDKSGETSYSQDHFNIYWVIEDTRMGLTAEDIKYIYWDITAPKSCESLFYECTNLEKVIFGDTFVGTSGNIEKMHMMFRGCEKLATVDMSGFDTSNVKDMNSMFYDCYKLKNVDVSGFKTSNVTDMSWMFIRCRELTSLDVSGFDTSNVFYMNNMFESCYSLESIDVSGFDTSKVVDMHSMFIRCYEVTSLEVSSFDTSQVRNMSNMFYGCSNITSLDLSKFDTSSVTNMDSMFYNCYDLRSLDISGFDTSATTSVADMFESCNNLHVLKTPNTHKATDTLLEGEVWYKLNSNKTIDRSSKLECIPVTTGESVTIIREHNHEYSSVKDGLGTCAICDVKVKFGDCDDDGNITVSDAVMLKKYLAGDKSVAINLGAADVNADKEVKVEDAVKLMKHLAGMKVKLGVAG